MTAIAFPVPLAPARPRVPRWHLPWERTKDDVAVALIGNPAALNTGAFVTTANATSYNTGSVTIPASSLVVVVVGHSNATTASGDPSAVSDGTTGFTKAAADTRSTTTNCSIWFLYYAAGATKTITATVPTSNAGFIQAWSISAAAPTSTLDATDNGTGSGGTTGATVSTSANVAQADEVAIFAVYYSTSAAATTWPPTNFLSLVNINNATRGRSIMVAYKNGLTAAAVASAAGWLLAGAADWAAPLATFKGVASTTPTADQASIHKMGQLMPNTLTAVQRGAFYMRGWRRRSSGLVVPAEA